MPPNNKSSLKSNEDEDLRLVLEGRRPLSKCYSTEETSIGNVKIVPSGITHSKSQTNVRAEERQDKDGRGGPPQRNRSVCSMVDELLCDIYSKMEVKRRTSATTCDYSWHESDYCKCTRNEMHSSAYWKSKDVETLRAEKGRLEGMIAEEGNKLVKHLKRKNFLLMKREAHYDVITAYVQAVSTKTREDTKLKFSLTPGAETGFSQWLDAMKMVAQLPGGMPSEFRTKLWLQLSEKHLHDQNIDWEKAEAVIFNEWTNPDDEELGVQIVKDLHRTGCSLFCGEQEHNQALLKRVLLAYARWNKNVGYCQGFNMLAALILQVMDRDERNAVKVMIYLIEGVLPESYFANNLRGLSVDMAVFRDLLRLRLPKLSKHLEALQHDTNAGTSYEPPLTNVFTMQWFLTLFSNCLPQQTVLRVWDLVFLHGNEILLRTALAIWGILQDRVITVESADEFYSIMGVITREMLEFGLMDANALVKMIAMVDPFPNELQELREKYLYNISPWTQSVQSAAKKGIRLFYSDPEDQDDTEDEDKIALATAYGVFRRRESASRELQVSGPTLDIGILKQQYAKLRQRQRQAHVIITAACNSNLAGSLTGGPSVSVNHLLMGKSALVNKGRRIGPPEGSIPPPNNRKDPNKENKKSKIIISGETVHWKDAEERKTSKGKNKNKGNRKEKGKADEGQDFEKMVTEISVNESLMKRDSDSGSSGSSTSTELCDDEFYPHTDFDSDSDASSYRRRDKSPDFIRRSPRLLETCEEFDRSPRHSGNGGCDKDNLKELENVAINLVNEIEEKIQTSEKLAKIKMDETREIGPRKPPPEVNNSKIDNTSILDTDNQLLNDNILKLEPKVPTYENVIAREVEVSRAEMENPTPREGVQKDKTRRKSDLALSVIKENLEMLSKFSQKGLESQMEKSLEEDREIPSGTEGRTKEENGKRKLMLPLPLSPELKTQKTETEPVRPHRNFLVEKAISPMVDKTSKTEKVNKEVNTELTFGVEEVEISTSKSKHHAENEPKPGRRQNEELLIPITSRKSREAVFREKDEIKQRIETSKSDWELKMKKIAELETTTRETLNEMQTRSVQRKSLHRSLDRNPRRTYFGDDLQKPDVPKIELEWTNSTDDEMNHRKMKISALSFDEITSRTEKLLGTSELGRSEETSRRPSPESEMRKPKDSTSKFKKLIEESYGEADVKTKTGTRKYEFLSSPTSPEYRTVSNVRYSDFHLPKKYAEGLKGGKYKDDVVEITQNGSKISVDLFERKCLSEKQKPETEPECLSSAANFNPFPRRSASKPKELGVRLGLYPTEAQSKKS